MTAPTACEGARVIRWVVVIFLAVIVFSSLLPWLEKLGIGRLPGDLRFRLFGRTFSLPFASTILLSTVVFILAKIL
nr:DUF2905 domain-containing protein [Herbaspirillum sp. SJZ102]